MHSPEHSHLLRKYCESHEHFRFSAATPILNTFTHLVNHTKNDQIMWMRQSCFPSLFSQFSVRYKFFIVQTSRKHYTVHTRVTRKTKEYIYTKYYIIERNCWKSLLINNPLCFNTNKYLSILCCYFIIHGFSHVDLRKHGGLCQSGW